MDSGVVVVGSGVGGSAIAWSLAKSGANVLVLECCTRFARTRSPVSLDPFCRAYGHGNLYVVDGSSFPSAVAVPPTDHRGSGVARRQASDDPNGGNLR